MAEIELLPLADYPNGSRSFGPRDLPDGVGGLAFSVDRCTSATPTIWPNASTTIEIAAEVSVDGGPWNYWIGFTAAGGIIAARGGGDLPASFAASPLPAGVNRRIRATAKVVGGPLRSRLFVRTI